MNTNTSGAALIGDGTNFNPVAISGDITIAANGTAAIGSGVIVNADINSSAAIADSKLATISTAGKVDIGALEIDGATDIGGALADADLFIVDDGANGTERKMAASRILTYVGASAGAFSIANLDIDGGTDIGANLADADLFIVDDGAGGTNRKLAASRILTYVGASAGAFSIANLDIDGGTDIGEALADADLLVVDNGAGGTNRKMAASRLQTYIEGKISGDITISSGTAAIGSGVIVNADINSSAAIADSKLATISTAGKVDIGALEIDGATDIGADLADADLIIVDDGGGGTERKAALSRMKTYIGDPTALAIALG
jgi:prefoldin subunit 5